jgi:PleD family two-component response regulator
MVLQGKRIIYIVDDERNGRLVDELLSNEGATVMVERRGTPVTALLKVTSSLPVDLILLDSVFSNGFTGYIIFDELRQQAALDDIPIVLLSGKDAPAEMVDAHLKGFNGCIARPIDAEIFADQIRDVVEGRPVW